MNHVPALEFDKLETLKNTHLIRISDDAVEALGMDATIMGIFIKALIDLEMSKHEIIAYKIITAIEKQKLQNVQRNFPIKKESIEGLYKVFMLSRPLTKRHEDFLCFMNANNFPRNIFTNFENSYNNMMKLEEERRLMKEEDKKQDDPTLANLLETLKEQINEGTSEETCNKIVQNAAIKTNIEINFDKLFMKRLFLTNLQERIEKAIGSFKEYDPTFNMLNPIYPSQNSTKIAKSVYQNFYKETNIDSWYPLYMLIEHKLNEIELLKNVMIEKTGGLFIFPSIESIHDGSIYDMGEDELQDNPLSLIHI